MVVAHTVIMIKPSSTLRTQHHKPDFISAQTNTALTYT